MSYQQPLKRYRHERHLSTMREADSSRSVNPDPSQSIPVSVRIDGGGCHITFARAPGQSSLVHRCRVSSASALRQPQRHRLLITGAVTKVEAGPSYKGGYEFNPLVALCAVSGEGHARFGSTASRGGGRLLLLRAGRQTHDGQR